MSDARWPPRLRGRLRYAAYLLLCAELLAKALLLLPPVRARLPPEDEAGWRIRWVNRRLWAGRSVYYTFDEYDRTKGWRLKPGRWDLAGRTVTANSRGIRGGAEYPAGRRPGLRRIVVVGDSFTFGEGVGDGETFPSRLQARLGSGAEVINLGVHGYGHDQMLIHLREEGMRYAPDVVVLGFYADDVARNVLAFRDYAKPRFALRDASLVLTGSPVPTPAEVLAREPFRSHLLELLAMAWRSSHRTVRPTTDEVHLMATILDAMRRTAESGGARFVVVDLPPVAEIALPGEPGPSEALMVAHAASRGLPLCRTRSELRHRLAGAPAGGLRGHYDAAVQDHVADILAGCLAREGLLAPPPAGSASPANAGQSLPVHEQQQ
jgi:GDSL-like lipase/acylhydrolase family protein